MQSTCRNEKVVIKVDSPFEANLIIHTLETIGVGVSVNEGFKNGKVINTEINFELSLKIKEHAWKYYDLMKSVETYSLSKEERENQVKVVKTIKVLYANLIKDFEAEVPVNLYDMQTRTEILRNEIVKQIPNEYKNADDLDLVVEKVKGYPGGKKESWYYGT